MLIILGPYTERYRLSADTSLFQLVTQGHLAEIEYPGPTVQLLPVRSSVTRICLQFHPEANGGPKDTEFLFDRFLNNVKAAKEAR